MSEDPHLHPAKRAVRVIAPEDARKLMALAGWLHVLPTGEWGLAPIAQCVFQCEARLSQHQGMTDTHKEGPVLTRAAPHHSVNELVGPRSALVRNLTEAYWAELDTAATFLASSTNREGIDAGRIARRLRDAITSNLDHGQRLAVRINQLHGPVPGADDFSARQLALGPPAAPYDNASVLEGAIEAATTAIGRYRGIVAVAPEAADWVTRDLAIQLIREKETHRQRLQRSVAELAEFDATAI